MPLQLRVNACVHRLLFVSVTFLRCYDSDLMFSNSFCRSSPRFRRPWSTSLRWPTRSNRRSGTICHCSRAAGSWDSAASHNLLVANTPYWAKPMGIPWTWPSSSIQISSSSRSRSVQWLYSQLRIVSYFAQEGRPQINFSSSKEYFCLHVWKSASTTNSPDQEYRKEFPGAIVNSLYR